MAINLKYHVYVLVNETKPIYVGFTMCISNRIKQHKSHGKKFTGHVVVKTYDNKKDALIAENSLIRYLSIFGEDYNVNAKHVDLEARKMYLNPSK